MSGKGSSPRPFAVSDAIFSANYCLTFGHTWREGKCINCGQLVQKPAPKTKNESKG